MCNPLSRLNVVILMGTCVVASGHVFADVDLEWQPDSIQAQPGELIQLGVYAVASDSADEPFGGLDLVLGWDPDFLRLVGVVNTGPYAWLQTGFLDDSNMDGWNDSLEDGDAWYTAWPNFSENPVATDVGLLLVSFEFEVVGAVSNTTLNLLEEGGVFAITAVYDDLIGGLPITGDVGSATLQSAAPVEGDMNGDGSVDLRDFAIFQECFAGSDGAIAEGCEPGDTDGDGDVDNDDYTDFQLAMLGPQ